MFLKNENIIFKIRRSKVTDYAALNDVNVRGGNVIKPFAREIGSVQNFYRYSR